MSQSEKHQPFRWGAGTVELFISCESPWLFVATGFIQYSRDIPIGSDWERRVAQEACSVLNTAWEGGKRDFTEADVKTALSNAKRTVPYKGQML